jgi:HEAT repeat protein
MGPEAHDAVPALINVLKNDKEPEVRRLAAKALGCISTEEQIISALIEALGDENPGVCEFAAYALGEIGPKAKAALPKLRELAEKDFADYIVGTIEQAISKIEG